MSGPLKKLTGAARRRLGVHYGPLVSGSIALAVVWFFNGLWHGAGWHYLFSASTTSRSSSWAVWQSRLCSA